MLIQFLFPADPLDPRRMDQHFLPQRAAALNAGFPTSLVPESVLSSDGMLAGISPDALIVYRGWMVDVDQYQNLTSAVRAAGGTPITSPSAYVQTHHLPNWYSSLQDLTPETKVFAEDADLESELRKLGWPAFFIKDYVKSLKTGAGSLITNPGDAQRVVADMRRYRGVIEGGICVRRVERFVESTEVRYFVLNQRVFAPAMQSVPQIVHVVAARIKHPFFSVDVVATESGELRVVEIGDGQVSDLVGWSPEEFIRIWQQTA